MLSNSLNSNNLLSIFVGPESQKLSYFFYHLEVAYLKNTYSQQFFDEEDDPFNHSCLWSSCENKTPRALIYDFKNNISALEYLNSTNNAKLIRKLADKPLTIQLDFSDLQSSINSKLQKLSSVATESFSDLGVDPVLEKLFQSYSFPEKCLVEMNRYHADTEWAMYHSGNSLVNTSEKLQVYADPIRKMLELEDTMEGFVFWADTYNGYGSFTSALLDTVKDSCPKKPILFNNVWRDLTQNNPKKQHDFQKLNSLAVCSELRSKVDMFVPFNLSMPKYPYLASTPSSKHLLYETLAPLMSNLYAPFTLRKNQSSLSQYVARSRPFPQNNMFNIGYTAPLYLENYLAQGYCIFDYTEKTLERQEMQGVKENFINMMMPQFQHQKHYQIFSQSFVIKGPFELTRQPPASRSLDVKILQNLYLQQKLEQYFLPKYAKAYGEKVTSLPFHSVLFCSESIKHNIKTILQDSSKCDPSSLTSYYKLGIQADQIKEMRQNLLTLYDDYDKEVQDPDYD